MRVSFPKRGRDRPRLTDRRTPGTFLRGLARFLAAIAVAAGGGLAIGIALAKVSATNKSSTAGPARGSPVTTTIVAAVLHPARSQSGRRRQRARLSVHVRVTNRGAQRVTPARPVLVSGDDRVKTDPNQDSAGTRLRSLDPGATADVTLRFETEGSVTTRVRQERRASLIIAGQNVIASVKLGGPVDGR